MRFLPKLSFGWIVTIIFVLAVSWFVLKPEKKPIAAIVPVVESSVDRVLALNGRIRAQERVQILSKTSGRLMDVVLDEGDRIQAGQVIARLEANDLNAKLSQAMSSLETEKLKLAQASRDLKRGQELFREGFTSQAKLENLKLAVSASKSEVARLEGLVAEQKANMEDSIITAPFDGMILDRPVDGGQMVDPRTVIFEVIADGERDIEAEADEVYANSLKVGLPVKIAPAGLSGQVLNGVVSYLAPDINVTSGGQLVRVASKEIQSLPTGLSVSINIIIDKVEKALVIPRISVIEPRGNARVRIVSKSGRVEERAVKVIDWPAEKIIVTEGLNAGDQIILSPRSFAVGAEVETKPAEKED